MDNKELLADMYREICRDICVQEMEDARLLILGQKLGFRSAMQVSGLFVSWEIEAIENGVKQGFEQKKKYMNFCFEGF